MAGATGLPAIVQHAPQYLSVDVGPAVVLEAARRAPNIAGVKLETGPEGIESWRGHLGADFRLYGGSGGLFLRQHSRRRQRNYAGAKYVLTRRGVEVPLELRAPGPRRLTPESILRLERYLTRLGLVPPTDTVLSHGS